MIKDEIFRIKKGTITSDNAELKINFYFGLIFYDQGSIRLELYTDENLYLRELFGNKEFSYWNLDYNIQCITEEGDEICIDRLNFTFYSPTISKINMVSYGKLVHLLKNGLYDDSNSDKPEIHYLLLEGLNMQFSDFTETYRSGKKVENYNVMHRDHTTACLVHERHPYSQSYYLSEDGKEVIVDFTGESSNRLSYDTYLTFKEDYVSALNFLNGATVKVRRECYGNYFKVGKVEAEKNVLYSFPTVLNTSFNPYIPLNEFLHWGSNILSSYLTFNFDKFREWNSKIGLNAIIFHLNESEEVRSLDEKVFIQIIAFERMSSAYARYIGEKEVFIPERREFEIIKKELFAVLEHHKEKFGDSYNSAKSKIGNLNQVKRISTTEKMYKIINDFKIPITAEIENLINVVRHDTVHKGEIGEGPEALKTYYLLDEIIREIILRMTNYNGERKSRILLK